ncbi:TraE/TraK family type IV conjugative transfer system protein [Hydrogenovibrio marinus]|uniref:Uncharacterized protein n=1 Tax=Hydrogenovibrio marinus TaxID=28885 RepID=A0A066ZXC7_HYDMR|nr:TraE/TraK family type IV conjugative transfer system protein [Hydrogenovibrio marinus]KDN94730.1 hypothetical protein EI16_12605 [Hydrogenovibrio marinus]
MDSKIIEKENSILERALKKEKGIRFVILTLLVIMTIAFIAKSADPIVILKDFGDTNPSEKIEKKKASKTYLRKITDKVTSLAFIYSPKTAARNFDQLLNIVTPSSFGEMQKIIEEKKAKIKRNNASSVFYPKEYIFDLDNQKVIAKGNLIILSGEKIISNKQRAFRCDYTVNDYLISLDGIIDVTDKKDPMNYVPGDNK